MNKLPETLEILSKHEQILLRIKKAQKTRKRNKPRFFANDNISEFIEEGELKELEDELTEAIEKMLRCLVIDVENDHNSQDTPRRLARMMLHETMHGRYYKPPKMTEFPDISNMDQIYCLGPVTINSLCSHHHQNITGEAYYGVFPSKRVIGISKFARAADWIMRRPQIQEESTTQLADYLEKIMKPRGIAVLVKARHDCCGVRGVKDPGMRMTTSVMRGVFREDTMKAEFFRLVELNSRS